MIVLKFFVSVVYVLASVGGFVTFFYFCNYPATVWALVTGISSMVTLHIHWLYLKNKIHEWYTSEQLRQISYLGFWLFTVGAMGLVYHTAVYIMLKPPILPINDSEVIRLVWAFLELKSGLMLLIFANSYANMLSNCDNNLLIRDSDSNDPTCT